MFQESSIHSGIVSCLHSVVLMADDDILDSVITKMENFLKVEFITSSKGIPACPLSVTGSDSGAKDLWKDRIWDGQDAGQHLP